MILTGQSPDHPGTLGADVIAPRRMLFAALAAVALLAQSSAPGNAQGSAPGNAQGSTQGSAQPLPKPKPKPAAQAAQKITTDTKVYLLRGLLNIFSLGMDALSDKLNAMGIKAEVFNHDSWPQVASRIIDDYAKGQQGAVVLIGHSLGADVLFNLTERLERDNIPVRLVVPFDPTASYEVTKNVDHLLNFYQLNGFGRRVSAPKGYKGELVNMDLSGDESFGHGSIDKSEKLHDLVIAKIKKVALGPAKKRPASPKTNAATTAAPGAKPGSTPPAPAPTPIANQDSPRT